MSQKLTPEVVKDLKSKHEELHQLNAGGETFVVTPPTRASWQRFSERVSEDAKRFTAIETLVRDCVVFPSSEELDAILTRRPALAASAILPTLVELAGAEREVESKKL